MKSEVFTRHRDLFAAEMMDNSVAVFFSGSYKRDIGDQFIYPFSVERNFFYFTGISRENMVFMVAKVNGEVKEALYIPAVDELWEIWNHRFVRREEAIDISGINNVLYTDAFEKDFAKGLFYGGHIKNLYIFSHFAELNEPRNPSLVFAEKATHQYPGLNIVNCIDIMMKLRSRKDEDEIAEIQKAVDYTKEALDFMVADLKPGKYEYELKARFEYSLALRQTRHRFRTVVSGGPNNMSLHYIGSDYQFKEGDLLLCDLGAYSNNYVTDLARTYPVSGKFTPRQKEIYNIVYDGQQVIFDAMRDGESENTMNRVVREFFAKALKSIKLIKDGSISEVNKYLIHGVGHPIGLDLHDFQMHPGKMLVENGVYTVEPGLYLPEEGFGVRLEDNVVITKTGVRVLSADIPKKLQDIENLFA